MVDDDDDDGRSFSSSSGGQEDPLGLQVGLHPGVHAPHQHPVVQVAQKAHTHTVSHSKTHPQ